MAGIRMYDSLHKYGFLDLDGNFEREKITPDIYNVSFLHSA